MALETSIPQSRRALLAAAAGGLVGFVASAIGQPAPAEAAIGDPLKLGKSASTNTAGTANTAMKTNSTGSALQVTQNGSGSGLKGVATAGHSAGVIGQNTGPANTGAGVKAVGGHNDGVYATSNNVDRYAVHGVNLADGDGVRGDAGIGGVGVIGVAQGGFGVYGTSPNLGVFGSTTDGDGVRGEATGSGYGVRGVSADGVGVWAESAGGGAALYAASTTYYAGVFSGRVRIGQYIDVDEMATPASPPADRARLFVRDVGGATTLSVKFADGTVIDLAAQP